MIKRTKAFTLLLFAFLSISLCQAESPCFGILIPLSGNFSPTGEDSRRGVELALHEPANRTFSNLFTYEDTQADPKMGLAAYQKLVTSGKFLSVYLLRGPIGMALNPISKRDHFPVLGGVANVEFSVQNPYAFQLWSNSESEGEFLANELSVRSLADKTCAVTAADDFTVAVTEGLKKALLTHNKRLIIEEIMDPNETDFKSILLRVKKEGCQAVFMNIGISQYAAALKRFRELQLTAQIYTNFWLQKKEVLDAAGKDAVEGVKFIEMSTNYPGLLTAHQALFGEKHKPTAATISSYAATQLLLAAFRLNPGVTSHEEFYKSLSAIEEIQGLGMRIPLENKRVLFPMSVKVIKNGEAVVMH